MQKVVFVSTLLLANLTTATLSAGKDGRLDPGPITWPMSSWVISPLLLSRSNGGESASIYINYRLTTTFTGKVYFQFPSEFVVTSHETVSETYPAGSDLNSGWISVVALPTISKGYGPIKIWTRNFDGGQIIDRSDNFASVFVTPQISSSASLTVIADTATVTVKSTPALYFQFNVDFDFWPNDVVVLKVPSVWTAPATPTCESVDIASTTNVWQSYDPVTQSLSTNLDCVTSESSVLVYGMNQDIDISVVGGSRNNLDFKLKISSFTAPAAKYTSFTWNIEILRANTYNIIKKYLGTNKPDLAAGAITISSWTSTNGFPTTSMKQNVPVYMTTTFTTQNPIDEGGKIEIDFSDDQDSTSPDGCYTIPSYLTCSIPSAKKVRLIVSGSADTDGDGNADGVAAGSFTFYTLNTFNAAANTATLSTVVSYLSSGEIIDQLATSTTITTTNATVTKMQSFNFYGGSDAANVGSLAGETDTTGQPQKVIFCKAAVKTSGTINPQMISLRFPFSTSSMQYLGYYIPPGTFQGKVGYDDVLGNIDVSVGTAGYSDFIDTAIVNHIYINTSGTVSALNLAFAAANTSTNLPTTNPSEYIVAPFVAKNIATRYEAWLIVQEASASFVMTHQFNIVATDFDVGSTVTRVCGNVIKVAVQPTYDFNLTVTGKTFYLQYENSNTMTQTETGVAEGGVYPAWKTNYIGTLKLGSGNKLYSDDVNQLTAASTLEFYTSIPGTGASTLIYTYYYSDLSERSDIQFVIFTEAISVAALGAATGTALANPSNVNVSPSGVAVNTAASVDLTSTNESFSVQVPKGFFITGNIASTNGLSTSINSIQDLTNVYFAYPSAVSAQTSIGGSAAVFSVDARAFWEQAPTSGFIFGSTSACFESNSALTAVKGAISNVFGTPTACTIRGPDAYDEIVQIQFTTANGLYDNGKIVVVLGGSWEVVPGVSTCTTSASRKVTTAINLTTGTCTIDQLNAAAAGQIQVTFNNVLPPNSASASPHWTSIKTTTETGETIDDATGAFVTECAFPLTANVIGRSTFKTASTLVPSNAGYTGADLYLIFSLGKYTPAKSLLKITSPTGFWVLSTDLNNKIYFSKIYSAVSITGAVLQLTLEEGIAAGAEVELYVEGALTFTEADVHTSNFLIETIYQSVVLNQDTLNSPGTNSSLPLTMKASGTISGGIIPVSTDTSNGLSRGSNWTFSFSSNQPFVSGDQFWIQFPKDFDPDLGSAMIKYTQEPTIYYIPCSSEQLGTNIECVVDHNYLKVLNSIAQDANTNVALVVYGVTTPYTLGNTGDFKLFHINNYDAKAIGTLSGIATTALPQNSIAKKVTSSNTELLNIGDYTFEFYLDTNMTLDHNLVVYLPGQYDTELPNNSQEISCSLAYVNHANDSISLDEQTIIEETFCNFKGNQIELEIPSGGVVIGANIKLVLKITGLKNPEWGYIRTDTYQ